MLWFGWRKELKEIQTHIERINHELGNVQRDVGWLKWLVGATFLAAVAGTLKDWLS